MRAPQILSSVLWAGDAGEIKQRGHVDSRRRNCPLCDQPGLGAIVKAFVEFCIRDHSVQPSKSFCRLLAAGVSTEKGVLFQDVGALSADTCNSHVTSISFALFYPARHPPSGNMFPENPFLW